PHPLVPAPGRNTGPTPCLLQSQSPLFQRDRNTSVPSGNWKLKSRQCKQNMFKLAFSYFLSSSNLRASRTRSAYIKSTACLPTHPPLASLRSVVTPALWPERLPSKKCSWHLLSSMLHSAQ